MSAATVACVVEPSGVTRATYILQPGERPTPSRGTKWGVERLRRLPIVRSILPVHERVGAVGGGPLSSSIALGAFLSLFPLLLIGVAVLGFVSAGNTDFAAEVVDQLGLEGKAANQVLDVIDTAQESRRAASVVGLLGLAWAGLGVAGALENALNATWQVTGRGITSRLVAVAWLLGAGLLFLGSLALGPLLNELPGPATVPTILAGLVIDILLFLWMFVVLTNVDLSWRVHLPGAVLGAVGLGVLKIVGSVYVPRAVASASALYGSLGVVFAILAWLALMARLIVYAAALNVVRYERQHGTVTVDIKVPHISGQVPLGTNRGGAVSESASGDR
jgi:membrane protein